MIFLFFLGILPGYGFQLNHPSGSVLQQDYAAAEDAQSAGNMPQAAHFYTAFLAQALDRLGGDFTHAGDFVHADALFDEGLLLDPENAATRLDYARESAAAGNLQKARELAEEAVRRNPRDASARLELGTILLEMKENLPATKQLEAAVALDPNYPDGLALAKAYLAAKDEKNAAAIFAEMRKGFGDTAQLHLDFGLAYAESGDAERAIPEFKEAIAKNNRLPEAHYCLGAAYLQSMGEIDFPLAQAEFKKELEISPEDFLSYSQLGYIALAQHRFAEAEKDLNQAATLNPQDPDVFLSLGQLYTETKETAKAEAALRKSIALTRDVSRNHYQVQRAHYLLARLLLQAGDAVQAKQQMQIAEEQMKLIVAQNQGTPQRNENPKGSVTVALPMNHSDAADPRAAAPAEAYEKQIAPAIADSYNNLGVIAASAANYSTAVNDFESAARWNPQLAGIDYNLGKAAYFGSQYDVAIPPLQRFVSLHPQEDAPRRWLAESLHAVHVQGAKKALMLPGDKPARESSTGH